MAVEIFVLFFFFGVGTEKRSHNKMPKINKSGFNRISFTLLKNLNVVGEQQHIVEDWLTSMVLHIMRRNEIFGVPVILSFDTIKSLVVLLSYFFKSESKLHSTEGGEVKYTTDPVTKVKKETKSAFSSQWVKQYFKVVLGCPKTELAQDPIQKCYIKDKSHGRLTLKIKSSSADNVLHSSLRDWRASGKGWPGIASFIEFSEYQLAHFKDCSGELANFMAKPLWGPEIHSNPLELALQRQMIPPFVHTLAKSQLYSMVVDLLNSRENEVQSLIDDSKKNASVSPEMAKSVVSLVSSQNDTDNNNDDSDWSEVGDLTVASGGSSSSVAEAEAETEGEDSDLLVMEDSDWSVVEAETEAEASDSSSLGRSVGGGVKAQSGTGTTVSMRVKFRWLPQSAATDAPTAASQPISGSVVTTAVTPLEPNLVEADVASPVATGHVASGGSSSSVAEAEAETISCREYWAGALEGLVTDARTANNTRLNSQCERASESGVKRVLNECEERGSTKKARFDETVKDPKIRSEEYDKKKPKESNVKRVRDHYKLVFHSFGQKTPAARIPKPAVCIPEPVVRNLMKVPKNLTAGPIVQLAPEELVSVATTSVPVSVPVPMFVVRQTREVKQYVAGAEWTHETWLVKWAVTPGDDRYVVFDEDKRHYAILKSADLVDKPRLTKQLHISLSSKGEVLVAPIVRGSLVSLQSFEASRRMTRQVTRGQALDVLASGSYSHQRKTSDPCSFVAKIGDSFLFNLIDTNTVFSMVDSTDAGPCHASGLQFDRVFYHKDREDNLLGVKESFNGLIQPYEYISVETSDEEFHIWRKVGTRDASDHINRAVVMGIHNFNVKHRDSVRRGVEGGDLMCSSSHHFNKSMAIVAKDSDTSPADWTCFKTDFGNDSLLRATGLAALGSPMNCAFGDATGFVAAVCHRLLEDFMGPTGTGERNIDRYMRVCSLAPLPLGPSFDKLRYQQFVDGVKEGRVELTGGLEELVMMAAAQESGMIVKAVRGENVMVYSPPGNVFGTLYVVEESMLVWAALVLNDDLHSFI